jgi:hypothetical protein
MPHIYELTQSLIREAVYYVNVKDVAVLHVATILDEDTKEERIQAWAAPFSWNDVLTVLRRLYPAQKFVDDFPESPAITATTDDSVALRLLKKWAQQDGWRNLEDTVRENISSSP